MILYWVQLSAATSLVLVVERLSRGAVVVIVVFYGGPLLSRGALAAGADSQTHL